MNKKEDTRKREKIESTQENISDASDTGVINKKEENKDDVKKNGEKQDEFILKDKENENGEESTDESKEKSIEQSIDIKEAERKEEESKELEEIKEKYLRLYSEFENFRRRTAKEKLELINTANEKLILDLLPVLDDFDRAQDSLKNTKDKMPSSLKEGFELIQSKFSKTLFQKGLEIMKDVKKGEKMDTEFHEAITQVPVPNENMKGKIVDVIEKGYLLYGKVIRYAKVVIGS